MPYDITMCNANNCPIKETCLRFTGARYARQDFFGGTPYDFTTNTCSSFMTNLPSESIIRLSAYFLSQRQPNNSAEENWIQAEQQLFEQMRR